MRILRVIIIVLSVFVLLSCSTAKGTVIVTGQTRPAITPTEVKLYLDPPTQYETIGLIEASCDVDTTAQKAQDMVIDELKKQAAKVGANGVLLTNVGNSSNSGVFSYGVYIAIETRTAKGEAIFVIKE